MRRKNGRLRLWAVAFWLLVWQGGSMALAATTGGKMLLLASPLSALWRLLQLAGTVGFWQAVAASAGRILGGSLLPAGGGVRRALRPFPAGGGVAGSPGGGGEGGTGGVLHHSDFDLF